jgi:type I restriction enzyme S subunit
MDDIRENGRVLSDSIQHISETAVKGVLFKADSIIIATSATIGEHALITSPFLANQRFTVLTVKNEYEKNINIKFFFYYCFIIDEWCKENLTIGHFATVDMSRFKKLSVPLPPLSEQARIVEILDKFNTLTTDITKGLPAEIAARQKQYEYYRDKLLMFKELTA